MSARKKFVLSRDPRSTTGVIGVSLCPVRIRRAHDVVTRHYYHATAGPRRRRFCCETLGATEAFRRAVAMRAAYEQQLRNSQSTPNS